MSFRYDVSIMISLLLILIVGLNYLYISIVVFIIMVKIFMKHTNDVTRPKNHAHPTVVFIKMVKSFTIKHTLTNDVKHKLSVVSLFSSSCPRYHPWFSSDFCDARRSSSLIALPSFNFASCTEFH